MGRILKPAPQPAMEGSAAANRITDLFRRKGRGILSVYYTAGYPGPDDTLLIAQWLQEAGADLIEIGIPFSDPVADGPTIQASNKSALEQGMGLKKLFADLKDLRQTVRTPVVLMGYLNPVMRYGAEAFCRDCAAAGVDGLIIPDLPVREYELEYRELFAKYGLLNIFLITPQTGEDRIRAIDAASEGFIYMVSSASTTGAKAGIATEQEAYFQRIAAMGLRNPGLIGFGISDRATFQRACAHAAGAIIGSAFIDALGKGGASERTVKGFITPIISERP